MPKILTPEEILKREEKEKKILEARVLRAERIKKREEDKAKVRALKAEARARKKEEDAKARALRAEARAKKKEEEAKKKKQPTFDYIDKINSSIFPPNGDIPE